MKTSQCLCGCGREPNPKRHAGMPIASWVCLALINARAKKEPK